MLGIAVTTAITTPSTTFALVNTTATTVNFAGGATVAINVGGAANDTTWTGQSWTLTGANSTDNTVFAVTNTSNAAAASHSYCDISVGGTTSTGDPHSRYTIPGGTSWYAGLDNSDSDQFKIGTGTVVGTTTLLTLSTAGALTTEAGITAVTGNINSTAGNVQVAADGMGHKSTYSTGVVANNGTATLTIPAGGSGNVLLIRESQQTGSAGVFLCSSDLAIMEKIGGSATWTVTKDTGASFNVYQGAGGGGTGNVIIQNTSGANATFRVCWVSAT